MLCQLEEKLSKLKQRNHHYHYATMSSMIIVHLSPSLNFPTLKWVMCVRQDDEKAKAPSDQRFREEDERTCMARAQFPCWALFACHLPTFLFWRLCRHAPTATG